MHRPIRSQLRGWGAFLGRDGSHVGRQRARRRRRMVRTLALEAVENRCLLAASLVPDLPGVAGLQVDFQDYAAGQILVRFRDEANVAGHVRGDRLLKDGNLWRVKLEGGVSVADALQQFLARRDVLNAYPDYRVQATNWYEETPPKPNDNFYACSMLWGLYNSGSYEGIADKDIDAEEAWSVTRGAGVIVAVIDSGVDYTHPDLAASMWVNDEVANGIDDDRNGYVDDIYGYDFANNDSNPMDDNGHGTHVAGIIAATANNDPDTSCNGTGKSVIGVAPDVKIMALKFLDASGSGYTSNAIKALDYAVANGAKISNNSWGGAPYSQPLADAIDAAAEKGHIFVAAAGNGNRRGIGQNNDTTPFYPASYQPSPDTVISVAASTSSDTYATFSNYGPTSVDLAAPGVHIWSTYPIALDTFDYTKEGHVRLDGTSMAAPHVAGAAALVWSVKPTLTALEVKQVLLDTVDPISGRDTVSDGRLNAGKAVAAVADAKPTVDITSPAEGAKVFGEVTVTATATDDRGVKRVEFFVDGTSIGVDTDGANGWSRIWNTTAVGDGNHTLSATATDTAEQKTTDSISVVVDNVDDPPSVAITNPQNGATVSGTITVTATATDDRGVKRVEFFVDGTKIGEDTDGTNGWSCTWNTTGQDGSHTLKAEATDSGDNKTASSTVTVTVTSIQTIAQDGFESGGYSGGTGWSGSWTATGDVSVRTDSAPYEGRYHARLRSSTGYLKRQVNLGGATWSNVQLRFWAKVDSFEGSDRALVRVSTNNSTWTTVRTFTATDSDNRYKSYAIDLSGSFGTLYVAFDAEMNSTGDYWYIDAVQVVGSQQVVGAAQSTTRVGQQVAPLPPPAGRHEPASRSSPVAAGRAAVVKATTVREATRVNSVPVGQNKPRVEAVDRVFRRIAQAAEMLDLEELLRPMEVRRQGRPF